MYFQREGSANSLSMEVDIRLPAERHTATPSQKRVHSRPKRGAESIANEANSDGGKLASARKTRVGRDLLCISWMSMQNASAVTKPANAVT